MSVVRPDFGGEVLIEPREAGEAPDRSRVTLVNNDPDRNNVEAVFHGDRQLPAA